MSVSLFRTPGLFLTWGLKNGDWTPEELIERAHGSGFKWVAQEMGDPDTEPDTQKIAALRSACHARAMYFGIWEVKPRTLDRVVAVHPNFWILNVESDHFDYAPLLSQFRLRYPLLPAAVVTNCDLDPAPFIVHNVKAMPEAYQVDNAEATPENMVNRCKQMGWKVAFPTLGVYHGYPLSSYRLAGAGYSVYMAEGMQPADWLIAYRLNGSVTK